MSKQEGHKFPQKLKGDWKQVGNGKPTESIKKNMKGRWTIKWGNENGKTFGKLNSKINFQDSLKEYEEIEQGDEFNISSKSKGDLDYLKERHMNYGSHYKYLKENKEIVTLKPTDILSVKQGQLFVNNMPFELTDPDESLDWPKSVENNELITWFRGNSSMVNRWKPEEMSGYYTNLKEGDVNALNTPAKIQYTDNDDYVNSTDSNKSVPNVVPPLNMDTVANSIPNI